MRWDFRSLLAFSGAGAIPRTVQCLAIVALLLVSNSAKAWWDGDWSYRKKITVDGGPKGAALAADAGRVPLLIRLHDGNFKFADAKDDGGDLRFVDGDDKTPLKFHIDTYDGLLGIALIWVDLPAFRAGPAADIWLYYGNQNATTGGDPRGTYDADTTLVYHFGERDAPPRDQTAYGNNALTPVKSIDTGLIGRGVHLDGATAVMLPASPSLAILQNAQFSWSAWVKSDGAAAGVLFAKRDGQNALVIGFDQGLPYVSVTSGGTQVRGTGTQPVSPGTWHLISVTASDHVTLAVDGQPAATVAGALPALGGGGSLGADIAAVAAPVAAGVAPGTTAPAPAAPAMAPGFVGDLDELVLAKVARSPAFIAAAFATEGPDSHAVAYGADEENAGLSGGYFGVILRSVTIDGWVVIGILAVMMAISITVMINKAIYINRVARANAPFLELFVRHGANMDEMRRQVRAGGGSRLDQSMMYRIYKAADEELERRGAASRLGYIELSSQAVSTIHANLDRVLAREAARLNSLMVLLTIAISGGPFLGLLGTVVGVMITFAAIAASGDVNVNAIAPGIAAALVATVAGLAVAIPALFGYNYLQVRIKDITTEAQGFLEELVTRLAETYSGSPAPEKLAAE